MGIEINRKVSLDIIIVNWNSGYQLRSCLESIRNTSQDNLTLERVIVIDNASSDGSADELYDLEMPLIVKNNMKNRGFAAACNQGAAGSKTDYLLFLNPDVFVFSESFLEPIRFMQQHKNRKVGICGIQLVDKSGYVSRSCARFPTSRVFLFKMLGLDRILPSFFPSHFMSEWDHLKSGLVDQVIGAFFLVRRSLFETLGGFDERFFLYFEEVDLSFRAYKAGWRSFYLASAQAYHKGCGSSEQIKANRLFYSLKSRILFGFKHFSWWPATSLMFATLFLEPLSRLALGAGRRSNKEICETLKGYYMLWSELRGFIKLLNSRSVHESPSP